MNGFAVKKITGKSKSFVLLMSFVLAGVSADFSRVNAKVNSQKSSKMQS